MARSIHVLNRHTNYFLLLVNYTIVTYPAPYLIMINLCVDDYRKDIVAMVTGAKTYKEQPVD